MSFDDSKKLREQRAVIVEQMHDITITAAKDERELTPEEMQKFDRMDSDQQVLHKRIEETERYERVANLRAELETKKVDSKPQSYRPADPITALDRQNAMKAWAFANSDNQRVEFVDAAERCGLDYKNQSYHIRLRPQQPKDLRKLYQELRGSSGVFQGTSPDAAGGHTIDDEMSNSLEIALLEFGGMREAAFVLRTTNGANFDWPTSNDTTERAIIVGENVASETQSIDFGNTQFTAYKYSSQLVRSSVELLQDSNFNLAAFIGESLGTRIARGTNEDFTIGSTSTANPFGISVQAVSATTAAQDTVSKDSLSYEDLLTLQHSVDPAYRRSSGAAWMFGDSALRVLRALVDGDLRPLWQPGLIDGAPDRLLGDRIVMNNQMPAMGTLGNKPIVYGALDKYVIRDVQDIVLRRLDERYAEFGQVAWLALSRHDGKLLDAGTNPVKALVLGSST